MDAIRWWHICFAHSAKGISVKLNAELTKKQMMTKTCLVTNVFTFLTADRIASICHQIEHLSPHSTVVTTVEIHWKRVSYTKSRTFFLSLTTFFSETTFWGLAANVLQKVKDRQRKKPQQQLHHQVTNQVFVFSALSTTFFLALLRLSLTGQI